MQICVIKIAELGPEIVIAAAWVSCTKSTEMKQLRSMFTKVCCVMSSAALRDYDDRQGCALQLRYVMIKIRLHLNKSDGIDGEVTA